MSTSKRPHKQALNLATNFTSNLAQNQVIAYSSAGQIILKILLTKLGLSLKVAVIIAMFI